jgi:hypothetical protein
MKPEAGIIFEIAKEFGFQEKTAYAIVVEAMNSVGLAIDWKMNTLVRGIKEQLLGKYGYGQGTRDEVMGAADEA